MKWRHEHFATAGGGDDGHLRADMAPKIQASTPSRDIKFYRFFNFDSSISFFWS